MSTAPNDGKSKAQGIRKTLYLIRHAESEENRRLASLQSVVRSVWSLSWPDSADVAAALELANVPGQVDSPLSTRGRRQVESMRTQLEARDFVRQNGVELILHSPLQRARDTCLGLFHPPSPSASEALPSDHNRCRFEQTNLLIEKTPMEWILSSSFYGRLQEFVSMVRSRRETRIVAVGHSQFFRAMLHLGFKFDNCDVWHVELSSDANPSPTWTAPAPWTAILSSAMTNTRAGKESDETDREGVGVEGAALEDHCVFPPWSNLRRLLTCDSSTAENNSPYDSSNSSTKDKDI